MVSGLRSDPNDNSVLQMLRLSLGVIEAMKQAERDSHTQEYPKLHLAISCGQVNSCVIGVTTPK